MAGSVSQYQYKIPGKIKFRTSTRPIHKLVLIISVEEKTMEDERELAEGEEGYPTGPAPDGQEGKSNKQPPGGLKDCI